MMVATVIDNALNIKICGSVVARPSVTRNEYHYIL